MTSPTSVPPNASSPIESPPSATPPRTRAALWEDFIDILYAPSQVFDRRRDGRFGLAWLIGFALLVGLVLSIRPLLQPYFEGLASMQIDMMRRSGQKIPEEMLTKIASGTERFGFVGLPMAMFFFWLLTGCALWLVAKFFDARPSFSQAMMISTYANIPRWILGVVTTAVIALLSSPDRLRASAASIYLSPAVLVSQDTQPIAFALLSRIEPFTLWVTVLLGIGLSVVCRIPRSRAFAAAAALWVIGTIFALLSVLRQQAAMG